MEEGERKPLKERSSKEKAYIQKLKQQSLIFVAFGILKRSKNTKTVVVAVILLPQIM
jgi:hypothetical protein